jgi:hypothetical protein
MGLSDESMLEKIVDIIDETLAYDYDGSVSGFDDAADAIIAALPSMVKPLVWKHSYDGDHINDTYAKYVITKHYSGASLWILAKGFCGGVSDIGYYPSAAMAQAAADTDHVADVMAAFTGETQ